MAVFRQSIVLKKLYFHLDYISSNRSTKNSVERDWVGSIEQTSYRLGSCSNTEEEWRGLRTPQLPLHRFTTIVLVSHKDIILHSSQSSVTLFILSHCPSITHRCNAVHWHSTRDIGVHLGQGGPRLPFRSSRAHRSLTALHPSYMVDIL